MLVALRSMANGKFVCAENAGALPLIASKDVAAEWETFDVIALGGNLIAIRAAVNNNFVSIENSGASRLVANRDGVATPETFEKVGLGNNRFALKSMVNGKFVCAENAGALPLVANRDAAAEWETFEEFTFSEFIALKSMANGKFVCAENAGTRPLIANRDVAAEWETFEIIELGSNQVAIRAATNNKFVSAESNGTLPLTANRADAAKQETFEKVSLGNNKLALKSMANGKFVCAENAGALPLIASRDVAAEWEIFEEVTIRRGRFSPAVHGFKFENDGFANDVIPELNVRTNALCGGMAYAALDYYFSNMPIPNQPFRPASQTPLRRHLYNRQWTSIESNLDKWSELLLGLDARSAEFFHWGISARIGELKQFLDRGIPCVLCLAGGDGLGHQVVAYDYTMGRYRGDLGDYVEEFKIYVYDPNCSDEVTTIIADRGSQTYRRENGSGGWRTYFVDRNYHTQRPPELPNPNYPNDGLVHELALEFSTYAVGSDLPGGNRNVDLCINLTDGSQQIFPNINLSARWVLGSDEFAQIVLPRPVREDQLRELHIRTAGVNWDMSSLTVWKRGGGFFEAFLYAPAKAIAGSDNMLIVRIHPVWSIGLKVLVHLQGWGDMEFMEEELAGTRGESRQLEGFQITLDPPVPGLGLQYFAHVQNIGDTQPASDGQFVGTRGRGLRLEGFGIHLTGPLASSYYVEYQAHVQSIGDTFFSQNGAFCGTRGQGLRVEGIRVRVIKKG